MADKKKALMDSSSAILLYKSDFIKTHIDSYYTIISESVYAELNQAGYEGAEFFRSCRDDEKMTITGKPEEGITCKTINHDLSRLDTGERDSILLYLNGIADFIIMDDKNGNAFCRDNGIPYINALLVPKAHYFSGHITDEECKALMERIVSIGRYFEEYH